MRGKFIEIERPKGYVDINEVYRLLDGVEKEEDCEYGDFGEVLSKWATCDYGEVLEAISCCDIVEAIRLDKIKEARNEIENKIYKDPYMNFTIRQREKNEAFMEVLDILDKLIKNED